MELRIQLALQALPDAVLGARMLAQLLAQPIYVKADMASRVAAALGGKRRRPDRYDRALLYPHAKGVKLVHNYHNNPKNDASAGFSEHVQKMGSLRKPSQAKPSQATDANSIIHSRWVDMRPLGYSVPLPVAARVKILVA